MLDMNLEQVQLILYKLRSLGVVEPVRQFQKHAQKQAVKPFDPDDAIDRALRDAIAWDEPEEDVVTDRQDERVRDREQNREQTSAQPPSRQNNLVARMLKALSFGRRS
jgi:hypothetical protein